MKTIATTLLAAVLLSTSTFAAHTPHLPKSPVSVGPTAITNSYKVAIYPSAVPSKVNVMIEREPGKAMEISLLDSDGFTLATKYINKKEGNVHVKFDLSELNDGAYQIQIVSGSDKSVHAMSINTPTAQPSRTIAVK
ncbi:MULTISPECIES: T9SS type A sorting domain-containing protein [unclassified Spirosoma]|uniref:T9SS type A sorting domain-containing protein n=1 Tax=unclassified Spirosoma TaxID=2621999 RepID=UPI0009688FEA|nr:MULTISPECIES: T9SS type A sorting domain-containing protein [unclassified Spirosoma]MBN8822814.1 hypothetical protein [Spirosoma sp.]OJW80015.1 MAG: hypothetical protein BGO59_02045 [Spirosoma sp. 48-14]